MIAIWRVHNLTKIVMAGDNIFFIQFRSTLEKARVMAEGPWTFDRALIILKLPSISESINSLAFTDTPIWIQVHNIPFKCLTRKMAFVLGAKIGKVEEVDCDDNDNWTGPFMRIRINIEVHRPLMRGLKLRVSESDALWCPIVYEKLPDFCHTCGVIGHSGSRRKQIRVLMGQDRNMENG